MNGNSDTPDEQQERIDDLLADWQIAMESGQEITAQQLCRESPELLPQVRQAIKALKTTDWMLESVEDAFPNQPTVLTDARPLPASQQTAAEFLASVGKSGVLADGDVLAPYSSDESSSATQLAGRLIADRVLTRYQALALLEDPSRPLVIDRYVILDVLGEGGMGIVFKALHRAMDRIVALKVLPRFAVSSPEKVARFHREIKAVASITHPNVVAAYDAHEADGTWFLVMEYVQGKNLAEAIAHNGPLPPQEAALLLSQIAGGLAEAHRRGIIHRDIKPGNIMLSDDGVPKLLDLGLARTKQMAHEADHTSLTHDGIAMGTVDYMSPEQALDSKTAGARSDIYSLGCTLYYLISGAAPFQSSSAIETIVAHRERDAPSLASLDAEIPPWLQRVYLTMVAKDPQDRQASAAQVQAQLSGQAIASATGTNRQEDARDAKHISRRWPILLLTGTVLVIGTAFALMGWFAWPANEKAQPNAAVQSAGEIPDQRELARWVLSEGGTVDANTDSGLQQIISASEMEAGEFTIFGVDLFGLSVIDADRLAHLKGIHELRLDDCEVSRQAAASIGSMSQLQVLSLTDCDLMNGDADSGDLQFLTQLTNLNDLHLSGTNINPSQLKLLRRLPKLDLLALSGTWAGNSHLSTLPKQLQYLVLDDCDIDDEGIGQLAGIRNLLNLHLAGTSITDDGLVALQNLPQLDHLDLSRTAVTAKGLRSLRSFTSLKSLTLNEVPVTDAIIQAILSLDRLNYLDLSDTTLSDKQLLQLAALENLDTLFIVGTPTSQKAINRLSRKLPACDIYVDESDRY